jgi:hypothetical protein
MKQEKENPNWWIEHLKRCYIAKRKSMDRRFTGLRGEFATLEFWEKISKKLRPLDLTPEKAVEYLFRFSSSLTFPSPSELSTIISSLMFASSVRAERLNLDEMIPLNLNPNDWEDRRHFELLESVDYYKTMVARACENEVPDPDAQPDLSLTHELLGTPPWVAFTLAWHDHNVYSRYAIKAQQYFKSDPSVGRTAIRLGCPEPLVFPHGPPAENGD